MYLGQDRRDGARRREIFDNPLHPYTQALLSSVPTLTRQPVHEANRPRRATSPRRSTRPPACRFASRCFRVIERCSRGGAAARGHRRATPAHRVACFNYEPIASLDDDAMKRRGRPGDDG